MTALERWRRDLESWAVPQHILDQAVENPWTFPAGLFAAAEPVADSVSAVRAREALPHGGSVIDVGCGAGAASMPIGAEFVTGVDESEEMLAAFAAAAHERAISHHVVLGRWPDVAAGLDADVVVCHHVLYNVADLAPFVRALTGAARRRVVVEITTSHPVTWMAPLWKRFWDLDRPSGPTASDAAEAIGETGVRVHTEAFRGPPRIGATRSDEFVGWIRRRLCLAPGREDDVRAALSEMTAEDERELAAIWWDCS